MIDLDGLKKLAPSLMGHFSLKGKVALVVGGTKGIGQALAIGFAAAGADVCVASRGPGGLKETAQAISDLGRKGSCFAADVSDEAQVEKMVAYVLNTYGHIDILVNSQGIVALQPTEELDIDKWQRVIDVNLKSLVLCCKYAGREMLKQGHGKIINISSVRGFQGRAGDVAYAPSKGAVNQLTHSLAVEWGQRGINVNAIAPTFTHTGIDESNFQDEAKLNWVLGRIPMGRTGEVDDYIGPAIFLASDASNFINGHVLPVDGGWLAG